QPLPDIKLPQLPMKETDKDPPRTPPISVTGSLAMPGAGEAVPVEQLKELEKAGTVAPAPAAPINLIAVPSTPVPQNAGSMTSPIPTPTTPAP
ncbi:MAG TPA: hypothetical protein VN893_00260, partial [Bryobacteraceae bacterium]|nr:hypothetical protein [Bryobacteraceae bacterium]